MEGKKQGQILVEWGEFESRKQAEEKVAQATSDAEWIALQEERAKSGTIVPGSGEIWVLTDY